MTPTDHSVIVIIPAFQNEETLSRAAMSAARQRHISVSVLIVDHGSGDGTLAVAQSLAKSHSNVEVISLVRTINEIPSAARPLNVGLSRALDLARPDLATTWIFRLDADDVLASDVAIASQLKSGSYRALVMATLVFFDPQQTTAYEFGPRYRNRTLGRIRGRDAYAVAHHATAMRADLISDITNDSSTLYHTRLETGEDLLATCRLVRQLRDNDADFSFVNVPLCFKQLSPSTITSALPLIRALSAHILLWRECPELSWSSLSRGYAELALGRVIGENASRKILRYIAGENGHYESVPYSIVERRLRELQGADRDTTQ